MSQIICGHFTPDGELIYLPIGFIPDDLTIEEHGGGSGAIVIVRWNKRMEDDEASGSQEGFTISEGTSALLADDGGIAAYDSGSELPTITEWSAGATVVARSATAHGTYIQATTSGTDAEGREVDRSAIFEVVENTTTGATEPDWPTVVGEQCLDNHASPVRYEKVNVALHRGGYKGVRIAAALMTDGQEMYFEAISADQSLDLGDVDGWTGGIQGA